MASVLLKYASQLVSSMRKKSIMADYKPVLECDYTYIFLNWVIIEYKYWVFAEESATTRNMIYATYYYENWS
jgi:hypothetical protein